MPPKPPRRVVYYRDERGRRPAEDALAALEARVAAKVRAQVRRLEWMEWPDLLVMKIVKPLKGSEHICEVRVKGKGPWGQRAFFFLADCRDEPDCVITEIEPRAALNVSGRFDGAIRRGEERRVDWLGRNCPKDT